MTAPRVSILIPCLDDAEALEDALDLAFSQSLEASEILVIDRGTQDPSLAATSRALRWPRTRLVAAPGVAHAGALDIGLREAAGEFVAVFDTGVVPGATFLAESVQLFDRDPELGLIACRAAIEARDAPCTTLARRDLVRSVGGYEAALAEPGAALGSRLASAGYRVAIVPGRDAPSLPADTGDPASGREAAPRASLSASSGGSVVPGARSGEREILDQLASLESALAVARGEVRSLRASLSWRLTAPLRAIHRCLTGSRDRG